jgi:hypothetical protein
MGQSFEDLYAEIAEMGGTVDVGEELFDKIIRHKVKTTNNLVFTREGCALIGNTVVRPPYVLLKGGLW